MNDARTRTAPQRQTRTGSSPLATGSSARNSVPSSNLASQGSPKRAPASQVSRQGPPSSVRGQFYEDEESGSSQKNLRSPGLSRGSMNASTERASSPPADDRGLFSVIEHLATLEAALWSILDGLKSNASYVSFFCREYWGTSASQAQIALEKLVWNERLKRQVQQACVLESLSLGVASHLCSGTMQDVSLTILSRLRNLLYYIHENCLVLMDLVCQRWLQENPGGHAATEKAGHCPENLNLEILVRTNRYRQLRKGEHVMALRQHNEMISNVVRQLCRGGALRRAPAQPSRSRGSTSPSPGDRSPSLRSPPARSSGKALQGNILTCVNDVMAARTPLDRLRSSSIRAKMLQFLCFRPMLNVDGSDPDSALPTQDPYNRYGSDQFASDGGTIWFEPLPPMLCDLKQNPKLPPVPSVETYTLVLDLDETLVHYFEHNGMGNYGIRPGMHEFLQRMNAVGYELVIFTAATQDYADWVIDQIDPERLVHHRLYRQHALPWGPLFAKDLSRLGRNLDRTLIIDNVQENFMLQPNNGIFIMSWYDDPHDTALFTLTPLLEELIAHKAIVPEILDKYREQIPTWAGFDQFSQLGGEYAEYYGGDIADDNAGYAIAPPPPYTQQEAHAAQVESAPRPTSQQDFQPPLRTDTRQSTAPALYSAPPRAEVAQVATPIQPQPQQPQHEAVPAYTTSVAGQAQTQYLQQRAVHPAAVSMAQQAQRPEPAKAAPTFSKVAGPYQAQAPAQQQPQSAQHTVAQSIPQGHRPASAAVWGRTGLGPHQLLQPHR